MDAAPVPADEPAAAPVAPAPVIPEAPKKKSGGRPKTPWGAERGIDTRKERSTQAMIRKAQEQKAAAQPEQIARAIELAMTDRAEFERQLAVALAFGNFAKFCQLVWHVVEPATKLQWNWHHELIANTLQALFEDWKKATDDETYINAVRNAALNTCPGSLKSRITSVFFPVWCWLHRPGMKFICLSVNEDAAMRDARAARDLIRSDFFQTSFHPKWTLKGDQDAISNYGNTEGGERLSKPSGSQVVGLRADCVAGESMVATEHGDMLIRTLHEMSERGDVLPRVWSMSDNGAIELRIVQATKQTTALSTVTLTAGFSSLRCTPDHRIWTTDGYTAAVDVPSETARACLVRDAGMLEPRSGHISEGCIEDVYDIQVEGNHNFFANGILVHNCILYDDPNDPHEAENTAEREKLNSLFETNIYNRVNDPLRSLRIGIQQRVHTNDWTGFVIAKQGLWSTTNPDGWLHLVLPAEFDPERKFRLPLPLISRLQEIFGGNAKIVVEDQRIVAGVSVHPERFSADYLAAERKRWEGTANFEGQQNQAPVNKKGGQIQRSWFNWCRLEGGVRPNVDVLGGGRPRPAECHDGEAYLVQAARHRPGQWAFDWIVISIDAALQKTVRGSNWGLGVMAGQGGRRFVLDDRTQRGDILEILDILRDMIRTWGPDKILIEKKAAGESLRVMLQAEMAKGDLPPIQIEVVDPGNQGKEQRLDPCKPALSAGMLHLLDGAGWVDAFVSELAAFPFGMNDDRTDYVTMALNHYAPADAESNALPEW